MDELPFSCGHMHGENDTLSPALRQLKQEHIPLRKQMEQLNRLAQAIGEDSQTKDWLEQLQEVKETAIRFEQDLHPHSEREEDFLFPMMAQYIGRESGPIAVMEYEHEQGKEKLQTFITKIEQASAPVDAKKAKEIASWLIEACNILSQHFLKEENVLFPMAEQLLSAAEKELLAEKIKTV